MNTGEESLLFPIASLSSCASDGVAVLGDLRGGVCVMSIVCSSRRGSKPRGGAEKPMLMSSAPGIVGRGRRTGAMAFGRGCDVALLGR